MASLTPIRREIFQFIEQEVASTGIPPTFRSIQKAFGFKSVFAVQKHIQTLIQDGFLTKNAGHRGLSLADSLRAGSLSVPILGTVPAGIPKESTELIDGSLPVPDRIGKKGECFALRVSGDSMINAGIHDGDLIIVRKQATARNGEIVVALIDGEVTVKRLEKKKDSAWLVAENPRYHPIPIPSGKNTIQGKVIGIQRYYE